MSVPFFSTLGMELTWLWPKKTNEDSWISGYSQLLYATFREKRFPFYNCYDDAGALEICTPSFSDIEGLKRYYVKLQEYITRVSVAHAAMTGKIENLVYSREDTVSGGGHIHVAIPDRIMKDPVFLLLFLVDLFRDMNNRPYLNWIFNDWGNTKSAENFLTMREELNKQCYNGFQSMPPSPNNWKVSDFLKLIYQRDPKIPADWGVQQILSCFDIPKGYAVKVSDPRIKEGIKKPYTIEFRCFDTKRNLSEIEFHTDFVNSYLRYIEKKTKEGKVIPAKVQSREDIQWFAGKDRGLKQFKILMEEIGLDYGNYQHFIEINYRRRAEEGLLR